MPNLNRSLSFAKGVATELATLFADFTGAGAGAPTVSVAAQLLLKDNCAAPSNGLTTTIVRNGAGDYTFTLPFAPGAILNIHPTVRGTTANLDAQMQTWAITAGRIVMQVKVFTAAGVATDLASGVDFLRLTLHVNMSNT